MTRLDEIEARVNAATEGPWEVKTDGALSWVSPHGAYSDYYADNVFIAHAREDVPWLASELRAARAREEQLRSALLLCEDALVDDALDWHEAHVGRGEMDAEDCAVCVVRNALDAVPAARDPEGRA